MSDSSSITRIPHDIKDDCRDPVEELAAEFAERYRNGDKVTAEEYAVRHPELAEEIHDLFPTIAAMERLNTKCAVEAAMLDRSKPRRLGDYRIIEEIARGGMGIVYEAEQISLGRSVAVKVLPSHALSRDKDVLRFQREAQTAARLHHSNIVPVFGVGEERGQHYIVMQLIHGVGLDEILNEVKRVFVDGESYDHGEVSANRVYAIVRAAAKVVESDLAIQSTQCLAKAETVEVPTESTFAPYPKPLAPAVGAALGKDYFRNVAKIGLQAAQALQYAHEHNTLHRDIKPGNLILDEDGRVWIADFGLAKAVHDNDVTRSGDIVGTIAYAAPERFQGATTKASDIYSLGVTLHEMLTLQKAFIGDDHVEILNQVTNRGLSPPRKINRSVPLDLETIVMKAASSDPRDRYVSATALARDLEAFLEDRPIQARRLSHIEHSIRWCRRNRVVTAMACVVLCLVGAVIGLLAFGYHHSEQQRLYSEKERTRAERNFELAIDTLDEIFKRYTATPLAAGVFEEGVSEESIANETPAIELMPISKNTAALLEDLLVFYDDLAAESVDSNAVAVKAIAANRRVGDIHRRLGQFEDARYSYRDAIKRIRQLPEELKRTVGIRLETARVYNGLGLTFDRGLGGSWDQVKAHRRATAVLDHENPSEDEKLELAASLYLLHRSEQQQKRTHWWDKQNRRKREFDVSSNLERARSIVTGLKEAAPGRADYDLLLARCLLADQFWSRDRSKAHENQVEAIAILAHLVETHPDNSDYQFELGQAQLSIARSGHAWTRRWRPSDEQLAASEDHLRAGLLATEDLELQNPNVPKYYQLKKELYESLGAVLRKRKNLSEAENCYERAVQMQRLLIAHAEHPEWHQPWLYYVQLDHGKLLHEANQPQRAKDVLTRVANGLEELVAVSPNDGRSRYRHFRRGHDEHRRKLESAYLVLAKVSEQLGESKQFKEWAAKADELDQ